MRSPAFVAVTFAALAAAGASPARADWTDYVQYVHVGGFIQPQFGVTAYGTDRRAMPAIPTPPPPDQIGFSLFHARLDLYGDIPVGNAHIDYRLELEGTPQPNLYDAWIAARADMPGEGWIRVVVGQHRTPFSRQAMTWDPDLQFTARSSLVNGEAGAANPLQPNLQLGASFFLRIPYVPWIEIDGGVYNGEGRNVLANPDQNLMYVARITGRPINPKGKYVESGFGERQLAIAVDAMYNVQNLGDYSQSQLLVGADVFLSIAGFSAYGEFLWGEAKYNQTAAGGGVPPANFHTLGYLGQAGYNLPIPGYLYQRFEIAGRFEGLIANDTVPLVGYADPNQAHYQIVAGINYFQWGHHLKMQVNYTHHILPGDTARRGEAAQFDTFTAQITYRLE